MAAQCMHETGGWQSYWARTHNNPAGIGVNGRPGVGEHFDTPTAGFVAQAAHLLDYAVGKGIWTESDPRAAGFPFFGVAPALRGLNGRWATPGTTYGQEIAAMANRLVAFAATFTPSEGNLPVDRQAMLRLLDERYPLTIREQLIPAGNSNRPGGPLYADGQKWITVHETGNPNRGANAQMHADFVRGAGGYGGGGYPAGNYSDGRDPAGYEGVSFHWAVDDREAIRLLPRTERAWQASDGAQGTGNSSESIETCVNADGDWGKTKENLARLVSRLAIEDEAHGFERIAQHNKWARDGKNCPTRLRANYGAEWNALMARIRAILTDVGYFGAGPAPAVRNPQELDSPFIDNGKAVTFWVVDDVWERYSELGENAAPTIGLPITHMYNGPVGPGGRMQSVQHFQRGTLTVNPDQPAGGPWRVVQLFPAERAAEIRRAKAAAIIRADVPE